MCDDFNKGKLAWESEHNPNVLYYFLYPRNIFWDYVIFFLFNISKPMNFTNNSLLDGMLTRLCQVKDKNDVFDVVNF